MTNIRRPHIAGQADDVQGRALSVGMPELGRASGHGGDGREEASDHVEAASNNPRAEQWRKARVGECGSESSLAAIEIDLNIVEGQDRPGQCAVSLENGFTNREQAGRQPGVWDSFLVPSDLVRLGNLREKRSADPLDQFQVASERGDSRRGAATTTHRPPAVRKARRHTRGPDRAPSESTRTGWGE